MPRFSRSFPLLLAAVAILSAAIAHSQEASPAHPVPPAPAPAPVPALEPLVPEPVVPREHLSPVVADMLAALQEQREFIRGLRAELAASRDSRRSLQLERAIALAKQDTELRLLRIQADHARRAGRADVAASLDAAITALTATSRAAETSTQRPRPTPAVVR